MKRVLLCLLVLPVLGAVCGCSEMSPDDREFYGRGWVHPSDLDKERETRMPAHPETTGSLGSAPAQGSTERGAEWGAPERY